MFKSMTSNYIGTILFVTLFFVLCISINIDSSFAKSYNEAATLASKKKGKSSTNAYIRQYIKEHSKMEKQYRERVNKAVKIHYSKKKQFNHKRKVERLQRKEKKAIKEITGSEKHNYMHDKITDLRYLYSWLQKTEIRLKKLKETHRLVVIKKQRVYKQSQKETMLLKKKHLAYKKLMKKYKSQMRTRKFKREQIRKKYLKVKKLYSASWKKYMKLVKRERIAMKQYQQSVTILKKKIKKMKSITKKILLLRKKIKIIMKHKEVHHKHTVTKTKIVHLHHYYYGIENPLKKGKCLCPVIFKPVCGADGTSYSSPCVARCAGVKIASAGQCKCIPNSDDVPPVEEPSNPSRTL